MKSSELRVKLGVLEKKHGDQEVFFAAECSNGEGTLEIEIKDIAISTDDDGHPGSFLICDEDTLDGFIES